MANDNKLVNLADLKEAFDNLNTNKKNIQTAVSDPTASGTDVSFIASISQDAQGVITATKKTVSEATTSDAGLMSSADKTKLNGIEAGAAVASVNGATGAVVLDAEDVGALPSDTVLVTGVKGNAEANYRHGDVNITAANIGAMPVNPASIELTPASGASNGGFIDFHYGGSSTDTSRLIEDTPGNLRVTGSMSFGLPIATCEALASGIPTSSYSLISSYGSGVAKYNSNGDANNLRCIKFGNGLKRLTGLFRVTSALSSNAQICAFPSGFSLDTTKNGSIQAFPLMISTDGATVRTGQMSGGQILLFSGNMPIGTYIIDQFYF